MSVFEVGFRRPENVTLLPRENFPDLEGENNKPSTIPSNPSSSV